MYDIETHIVYLILSNIFILSIFFLFHVFYCILKNTIYIRANKNQYKRSKKGSVIEIIKNSYLTITITSIGASCVSFVPLIYILYTNSKAYLPILFISLFILYFSIFLWISLRISYNRTYIKKGVLYGIYDGNVRDVCISEIKDLDRENNKLVIKDRKNKELIFWTKETDKLIKEITAKRI